MVEQNESITHLYRIGHTEIEITVIYEKSAESGKIPDRAGKEAG
jgi:hypothetical protein